MAHVSDRERVRTVALALLIALAIGSFAFAITRSSEPVSAPETGVDDETPGPSVSQPPTTLPEGDRLEDEVSSDEATDSTVPDELAFVDDDDDSGFVLDLDGISTTVAPTTTVAPADPAPPAKSNAPGAVATPVPEMPTVPADLDLRAPIAGAMSWAGIGDAADPYVLRTGAGYYAYTTNTSTGHVPAWFSTDLTEWRALGDVLPVLPTWAAPSSTQTWAPAALIRGGTYVLYFTTRHAASNRQCIGVAAASSPEGPFESAATSPLVCQTDLGGSIDPSTFVGADGQAYLLFKNDGNCCKILTSIWSQPLSADGLSLIGSRSELLWSTDAWEGSVVEGPSMIEVGGRYHLIYSANSWSSNRYAMGHAVCVTAQGPCYKSSSAPWRTSAGGPGGGEFLVDAAGAVWIVLHEWRYRIGYPGGVRSMYFERLSFNGSPPVTLPPTTLPPTTLVPTTVPVTTTPPTTIPPSTIPPATVPPTTVPATTVPVSSIPATTVPPTTVPPTTVPPTTVPPTTVPSTTVPPTTVPPATVTPSASSAAKSGATLAP